MNNDGYASDSLYMVFKKEGTDIFPHLIQEIDNDKIRFTGHYSQYESDVSWNFTFLGVRAAYMIESVLSDSGNSPGLFYRGVIVKKDSVSENVFHKITKDDLIKVQQIYLNWWALNKGKPLNDLISEWRTNNTILSGSEYLWY